LFLACAANKAGTTTCSSRFVFSVLCEWRMRSANGFPFATHYSLVFIARALRRVARTRLFFLSPAARGEGKEKACRKKFWLSVNELRDDFFRERERRGQARRFDAEQADEPRHAVFGGTRDQKVGLRFAGAAQLRPDAGIVRHQRAVGQARPITANAGVETVGAARIDRVIFFRDPLDVRTKPHAAGHIEGDMNAKSAVDRRRINQPRKYRAAGIAEVIALAEHKLRHLLGRIVFDAARQRLRAEAGGIDDGVEIER